MKKYFCGIDNGYTGGWAVLNHDEEVISFGVVPLRNIGDTKDILLSELLGNIPSDSHVILEQGQKQPLFGCKGNFANGYTFGRVSGALEILNFSYELVNPKTWQAVIFKDIRGGQKGNTKGMSLEVCRRKYPLLNIKNDNISDAICLALYARYKHLGGV